MSWLQKKPRNYAGEFFGPTQQSAESGNWIFDLKTRDLVYLVRNAGHFKPGKDGNNWIRFTLPPITSHRACHRCKTRPPN